jgi:hypothetical protein
MRNSKGQFVKGHSELKGITTRSGYKLSEAHKQKIRDARAKQLPPVPAGFKYFDNKTAEILIARMSLRYKLWRESVFVRDDYTCQICGKKGGKLNADHIESFARYPEMRYDLSNGRTLCEQCHRLTPTFGGKSKKGFKKVNSLV